MIAALIVVVAAAGLVQLWQQDFFWRNPLAGATIERLTDFDGDEFGGAISADGTLTTFVSDRDGPLDVWASRIGSGEFVNLTKGRFLLTSNRVTSQTGFSGEQPDGVVSTAGSAATRGATAGGVDVVAAACL